MIRPRAVLAVLAVVALVAGLLVAHDRGLVLEVWVVALTALATLVLLDRGARSLRLTGRLDDLLPDGRRSPEGIRQLDALRRQLLQARTSGVDLRRFFRPNVVELASVRLARRHGVDLAAEPGRARALVGANVWELVRPDQPTPAELAGRGWPLRRLEELVLELEEI